MIRDSYRKTTLPLYKSDYIPRINSQSTGSSSTPSSNIYWTTMNAADFSSLIGVSSRRHLLHQCRKTTGYSQEEISLRIYNFILLSSRAHIPCKNTKLAASLFVREIAILQGRLSSKLKTVTLALFAPMSPLKDTISLQAARLA